MAPVTACRKLVDGLNATQLREILRLRGIQHPGRSLEDCVAKMAGSDMYELMVADVAIVLKEMEKAKTTSKITKKITKKKITKKTAPAREGCDSADNDDSANDSADDDSDSDDDSGDDSEDENDITYEQMVRVQRFLVIEGIRIEKKDGDKEMLEKMLRVVEK